MNRSTTLFATVLLCLPGCGNDAEPEKTNGGTAADGSPGKAKPKFNEGVDWNVAREQTVGPLKVRLDVVERGPALVGNDQDGFAPSGEEFLLVRLTLTNVGKEQRLRYSGWSTPGASIGGHTGRLLDENDQAYPAKTDFGGGKHVQGQVRKATDILQSRPLTDVLVFAAPPAGVPLKLELPGSVVLEDGHLRFAIPAVAVQRVTSD